MLLEYSNDRGGWDEHLNENLHESPTARNNLNLHKFQNEK
jgi:hypothetical protein